MRLFRYAWLVLAYNLAVIGWGAYVRATGSGAGCGSHWPLCNGDVVPRAAATATLIEYSHRVTSGAALVAIAVLLIWTLKRCPPGHPARLGAWLSMFFIVTEAAVGAGLVLFRLVADNASMARAMFMAAHLLNTFVLLGALSLTAWWLTTGTPLTFRGRGRTWIALAAGCAALLVAGASGAVAALGDTLFPSRSIGEAFAADLSAGSHVLIRLRLLHPVLAVAAALVVAAIAARAGRHPGDAPRPWIGRAVPALAGLQIALGFVNVVLLAPIWLQLAHLLVADLFWIAFVLFGAEVLADRGSRVSAARAA
jgi:heme A synthase